jgi:hypothetical protein
MKKLFMVVCFAAASVLVIAQNGKMKSDMGLLIFGGVNSSTLTGDKEIDNKSILGAHAGVGIKVVDFSKTVGLRTELIYSQQGAKYSYGEGYYGGEVTSKLNYLNLPVIVHYQNVKGFFAEGGLQPGLLLSAKEKRKSDGMGGTGGGTETTDIKKDLNSFALGVPLGAGYVFKKKFAAGVRLTKGLLNVIKDEGTYEAPKQRNFVLSARLSYFL